MDNLPGGDYLIKFYFIGEAYPEKTKTTYLSTL